MALYCINVLLLSLHLFHTGKDDQLVDNAAAYPSIHIHFCRPVVGSIAAPCFPGKQSTFFGHLVINKLRTHKQREMVHFIPALAMLAHTADNTQVDKLLFCCSPACCD